jgi:hypothetical protein
MPFALPLIEDKYWPIYFSSSENPIYFFLELLWTRLSYKFKLPTEIFGEDLILDEGHGFLNTVFVSQGGLKGWGYQYTEMSNEQLSKPPEHLDWEPIFLNSEQFMIIHLLCTHEELLIGDKKLIDFINNKDCELNDLIDSLISCGLIYKTIDGKKIKLLTKQCLIGIDAKGRFFAGENISGRVTRWAVRNA